MRPLERRVLKPAPEIPTNAVGYVLAIVYLLHKTAAPAVRGRIFKRIHLFEHVHCYV